MTLPWWEIYWPEDDRIENEPVEDNDKGSDHVR